VISHVALKKVLLNPSGPGDFMPGMKNKASLMLSLVNRAHRFICCSRDRVDPMVIIWGFRGAVGELGPNSEPQKDCNTLATSGKPC